MLLVNDIHSKLNPTQVSAVARPSGRNELRTIIREANGSGRKVALCGGRHAMGGQQFAADNVLVDMGRMNKVLDFDSATGRIRVEAGIQWPALMSEYLSLQHGNRTQWGIAQKQTGADRLSLGGAIAANIHGRGLTMAPFGQDVLSMTVIMADGSVRTASRSHNRALFSHVLGGYGLFGAVVDMTLQLHPRTKVRRVVRTLNLDGLPEAFASRIREGYLYGDFQFAIDPESSRFLQHGIFSCYEPVALSTPIPDGQLRLSQQRWEDLIYLAHQNKPEAFSQFRDFYLSTHGQIYWSDTHQLNVYLDDYHSAYDSRACARHPGSEVITELYVDLQRLPAFMADAAGLLRQSRADLIYGTVRLIKQDTDAFLPWAAADSACVIFNLHTPHTKEGKSRTADQLRGLADLALRHAGRFFLTYHRCASHAQVLRAYPEFPEFLRAKLNYDPHSTFCSDWYQHYRSLEDVHKSTGTEPSVSSSIASLTSVR